MTRRNPLEDFTRGRMIGKLKNGCTVTSVAAKFGINKSIVWCAWKAFQTTGTAVRKVKGGHPRTTTAGDDRYIILQAKRGRRQSASVIAQQLSTATGRQLSRFSMAIRLHKGGLFARHPERCLPLKVDHQRHCLQWCREHKNWTTANGIVSSLRMRVSSVDWPAYSPDLNPMKHVWDALERRIAARLHHPENTQQLKQMLIEECALLPQEMLHQLVLSMRRRCEATIAVREGHLLY
ncbi:transposable element Tcb2 transposase [Trichonephila clavipes]|nr:transposable element Tcb2 transposase [Trichonephila clavipes]